MESVTSFLHMGGYAAFIWPSFAITAVVLAGLFVHSLSALRSGESALRDLQAEDEAEGEKPDEA